MAQLLYQIGTNRVFRVEMTCVDQVDPQGFRVPKLIVSNISGNKSVTTCGGYLLQLAGARASADSYIVNGLSEST